MDKIIGIGDFAISNNKKELLKTFALSTCVAVTAYSPIRRTAGMVHIVLPCPRSDKPQMCPSYYATTGVPHLINKMCSEMGCLKGELRVELFGGANSIRDHDVFKIGYKNINTVKEVLNDLNIRYRALEIGGLFSRTLEMEVSTGKITITKQPITI